jgi:hypothetical protein|tara:strand:+ start:99 stop:239 length:141 start_codon:yes stop_codon:yes gene_type:complete
MGAEQSSETEDSGKKSTGETQLAKEVYSQDVLNLRQPFGRNKETTS